MQNGTLFGEKSDKTQLNSIRFICIVREFIYRASTMLFFRGGHLSRPRIDGKTRKQPQTIHVNNIIGHIECIFDGIELLVNGRN